MVKCPSCGSDNPTHVAFCGRCGESIPYSLRAADEQGIKVPEASSREAGTESLPMKKCNWCGEMNKWSANFCTNCGKDPHGRAYPNDYANDQPAIESRPRSGLPVAGGILTIVAGIAALAMGLMSLIVGYVAVELGAYGVETISCCGLIWVVLGLLAFGGGLMAVQRKNFWLALGGSIAGIAGIGFILGAVFAFIGLILIAVSRQEFDQ